MRILLVSHAQVPSTVTNFQRETLLRQLDKGGHQAKLFEIDTIWATHPDLASMQLPPLDFPSSVRWSHLVAQAAAESRVMVFDLRRQNGELPIDVCNLYKFASVSSSYMPALVSPEDCAFISAIFPPSFRPPSIYTNVQGYMNARQA